VAYQALFMPGIKSPEDVLSAYDAISAADVQRIAQTLIDARRYNLAAIGPFEQKEALSRMIIG
jgi:predicted Zn-dependent peptidase